MNVYNFEINNVTNFSFLGTEGNQYSTSDGQGMLPSHLSLSSPLQAHSSQAFHTLPIAQVNIPKTTVKVWNVSQSISEEFFLKFFTAADPNSLVRKLNDYYLVDITKDRASLIVKKLNNWRVGGTELKACIIEGDPAVKVRVWNITNLIPENFFNEFSKYVESESFVEKINDHYIIEVTKDSARMIVDKLNKCYIADTILRACIVGEEDDYVKIDAKEAEYVKSIFFSVYYNKKLDIIERIRNTYGKVLESYNYKTRECNGSCRGDQNSCMFYHGIYDKRRSLKSHRYTNDMCPYPKQNANICGYSDACTYSHSLYEQMFHPINIHTVLCPNVEEATCQKKPFCKFAHRNTPEMFYTDSWYNLMAHGTPNTFKFFVGAINEINKIPSNYDVKICLISLNEELLDVANKSIVDVLQTFKIKSVVLDTKPIKTDKYQVFLGTPDIVANYHGQLLNVSVSGALIVDGIEDILEDSENRMNLRRIVHKLNLTINSSKVNVVCVSNFYNANMVHNIAQMLGLLLTDIGSTVSDFFGSTRNNLDPNVCSGEGVDSFSLTTNNIEPNICSNAEYANSYADSETMSESLHNRNQNSLHYENQANLMSVPINSQHLNAPSTKGVQSRRPSKSKSRRLSDPRLKISRSKSRERISEKDLDRGELKFKMVLKHKSTNDRLTSSHRDHTKFKHIKLEDEKMSENVKKEYDEERTNKNLNSSVQLDQDKDCNKLPEKDTPESEAFALNMLGEENYQSYVQEKKEILRVHESEYDAYKTFPDLHPKYDAHYTDFLKDYLVRYRNVKSEDHKAYFWKEFWKCKLKNLMDEEWNIRKNELLSKYKKFKSDKSDLKTDTLTYIDANNKSMTDCQEHLSIKSVDRPSESSLKLSSVSLNNTQIQSPSVSQSQAKTSTKVSDMSSKFSVEGTLNLMEKISVILGVLGPSMVAMVKSAREFGIHNKAALDVFTDEDNIALIELVISKLEVLQNSSEDAPNIMRAVNWIKQLLKHAKNPSIDARLDLAALAESSMGKNPTYIVNKIKDLLTVQGSLNVRKEDINELFLKVCAIQFELQMKDSQ